MSSTASPTRRVLGEKNANAFLNILSPRTAAKASVDASALLSPLGRIQVTHPRRQIPPSSPRAGQKRRISEVDDVEIEERRDHISASQQTVAISDESEDEHVEAAPAVVMEVHGSNTENLNQFDASQQDEDTMDTQFELPADEMSQKTLEKMHEVALPQNSSQPEAEMPNPNLRTEDSQISAGMSSFVDFGASEPSQGSDNLPLPEEKPTNTAPSEEDRKALMAKKAADLRTRLQFAYFKVQTNQTTTPFSRLKVPESMKTHTPKQSASTNSPPVLRLPSQHRHAHGYGHDPTEVANHEDRISAARARATAQIKPHVHPLYNLPVPKLRANLDTILSSPPPSRTNSEGPLVRPIIQQDQLSSPPPSRHEDEDEGEDEGNGDSELENHTPRAKTSQNPPSSAIKGEIADSLLQLMRGPGGRNGMCGV